MSPAARVRWGVVAVSVLFGLAACAKHDEIPTQATAAAHPIPVATADYEFPLEWAGDYTFRWSAADDIDLEGPEALVVRAFAESVQLAMSVGARLAYPGYAEAVPDGKGLLLPEGGAYPPGASEGDWRLRWAGTFLARIVRIEPAPVGFTAVFCVDRTDVAESYDAGATYEWRPPGRRGGAIRGWPTWLTVHTTSADLGESSEPATESADSTPRRAPNYNVFDGWTVVDVWGPTPRSAAATVLADDCTTWTRANPHVNPTADMNIGDGPVPADPPPSADAPLPGWSTQNTD